MTLGLVGRKCGMTRVFTTEGLGLPVTIIDCKQNIVTQVKTHLIDKYNAVQVTTGKKKNSHVNKPLTGHFAKAGVEAGHGLWEFRIEPSEIENFKVGQEIALEIFKEGQYVDITGITKGKGFAGVIKRHNFSSQDETHGNSLSHRAPGSIGQRQDPGRVFKGKRMAGHMGNKKRTVQNLELVKIDIDKGLLFVKGAVPGANGLTVIVKPAAKKVKQS